MTFFGFFRDFSRIEVPQTKPSLYDNVILGVSILDLKYPGWAEKVCVADLDMENGRHCVLGQLYGHDIQGFTVLWPSINRSETATLFYKYGFLSDNSSEARQLKVLWAKEVSRRRTEMPA